MGKKHGAIACVTGASGMVGRAIVRRLIKDGYTVRALSRSEHANDSNLVYFRGELNDPSILKTFLHDADLLFHCAGELNNPALMWEINVRGTEQLLDALKASTVYYFCHLSSAGVIGQTDLKWVDEQSDCSPQNKYEKSKWDAEQLVAKSIDGCRTIILRPTNVIDETRPGALDLPMNGSLKSWLKVVIKGGECAHIVHAEDVAAAAVYFVSHTTDTPQCFFVSCDHEPLNTFAGIWALYKAVENDRPLEDVRPVPHFSLIVPHILRRIWRGSGNRGDVRYSSEKLISEGFKFPLGFKETVRRIALTHNSERL